MQSNSTHKKISSKSKLSSFLGEISLEDFFKNLGQALYLEGLKQPSVNLKVLLGYSNSDSSKKILDRFCEPSVLELGFSLISPAQAVSLEQFWWILKQVQGKAYGVYVSNSLFGRDFIDIKVFYSSEGVVEEVKPVKIRKMLKSSRLVKSSSLPGFICENQIEEIEVSGYLDYLRDQHSFFKEIKQPVAVDSMFGGTGPTLLKLSQDNKKVSVFNSESDLPRLMGYIANPSGEYLKWYTTFNSIKPETLFFAVSDDGTRLGVYDIKQDVELSSDSTTLLVLSAIKEFGLQTGPVALSGYHGKIVIRHASRLGYKVKRFFEAPAGKEVYDLKSGAFKNLKLRGCDNYDALTACSLIYRLCVLKQKSPGELVDEIVDGFEEISRTRELVFYTHASLNHAISCLVDLGIVPSFRFSDKQFYKRSKSFYPGLYIKVARDPETCWYYLKLESPNLDELNTVTSQLVEAVTQ